MATAEAQAESEASLVEGVLAELDGDPPAERLRAAIDKLRARGLAEPNGTGTPWLELRRGESELRLAAAPGVTSPGGRSRALLERGFGLALARVREREELVKVREGLELLRIASFEGLLIHDGGVAVECNDRLCEMIGYSREEVMEPGHMVRVVAPEELATAQERIRQRVEGEFLVTLVRKDGTRMRAEFCTKQTNLGDRPLRVVAVRDVTERERTAALLRESEGRLRSLLEVTFDGVAILTHGAFVDVSEGIEQLLEYPRAELIGKAVVDFVAPDSRAEVARRIQDRMVGAYEATAVTASGTHVPILIVSVQSSVDGKPVRVSAIRDLRESRRLEHERQQLELQVERGQRLESLGVLARGIAHDFNNLLVGVLGGAEILLVSLKDPEERAQVEAIHTAGQRAATLIKQMLAYAGRQSLTKTEPVDLGELWRELRALLDAALSKKAQVELALAPDSVVLGERSGLMQVFMNLLTNASDALANEPGRIAVTTERVREPDASWSRALGNPVHAGSWVLVRVRDTGVGMDQATEARIFEPFFTTKARGHGLGLGSCLGIVKAHGGAILVESQPGVGSTFSVLLPGTEVRSASPARVASSTPPCRVLVVDDEPLVRSHLRRLLKLHGFTVEEASDGRTGLEAVERSRPEVVLLDMMMPDLDGVDVIRRLRAAGNDVPIVLCSGDLDAAMDRGLEPAQVQGMLEKPFNQSELLATIERARRR